MLRQSEVATWSRLSLFHAGILIKTTAVFAEQSLLIIKNTLKVLIYAVKILAQRNFPVNIFISYFIDLYKFQYFFYISSFLLVNQWSYDNVEKKPTNVDTSTNCLKKWEQEINVIHFQSNNQICNLPLLETCNFCHQTHYCFQDQVPTTSIPKIRL